MLRVEQLFGKFVLVDQVQQVRNYVVVVWDMVVVIKVCNVVFEFKENVDYNVQKL